MSYADWSKAPEWAMWHGVDENGEGYWFDTVPIATKFLFNCAGERFELSGTYWEGLYSSWRDTLEQRPCVGQLYNKPSYTEQINTILANQIKKGRSKYGITLEDQNETDILERLHHLEMELADGLYYIQWIKDWVKNRGDK